MLNIEVTDKQTGINQTLELSLTDYAGNSEYVSVQAVDRNGNKSNTIQFKNPLYIPEAETNTPTAPEQSESAIPDGAKPLTPDGSGTVLDNVTDGDGKEFFTITSEDGSVFYMIIDRQRTDDNVYLLNAVTDDDLAAFAQKNGKSSSSIPAEEIPPQTTAPATTQESEPAPPPPDNGEMNSGTIIFIIIAVTAIYEPTFSGRSHGFRPGKSCHTALKEIENTFTGIKWVIEGDIKACFDSFDHHVLVNILRRKIEDEQFISLMWKLLKAGYMEQWEYHSTYSGTPQGSGCSPILANIYMSELDTFMGNYKSDFNVGKTKRPANKEYEKIRWKYRKLKEELKNPERTDETVTEFKRIQKALLATPYYPVIDTKYKRIQYNRYADDFVVGVIGSKADAEKVKQDIKMFLQDTLKLTLSDEKTKVTHSGDLIRYLGYDFTVSRNMDVKRRENGDLQRFWYGTVRLYVPYDKWFGKLQEYKAFKIVKDKDGKEKWKALHRGFLMNRNEIEIISQYNSEIRGIYNFYRLADNVSVLNDFYYIMKTSMFKTFAAKYNTSINKIKEKHMRNGVFGVEYTNKAGTQFCEFYNDGFTKVDVSHFDDVDILPNYKRYDKPNSLARRLKSKICEACGAVSDELHMHHVKRLKDLTGRNEFELMMLAKRRKSLALCQNCFTKTHILNKVQD